MIWVILGWLGQAAFFSRFLVQWHASERAGRSVAPPLFWWLSLVGSLLVASYTIAAREPVLAGGYFANGWVYARNLRIAYAPQRRRRRWLLIEGTLLGLLLAISWAAGVQEARAGSTTPFWLGVSIAGQLLWSGRFLVQWIASERSGRSHFPALFWWLSLAGNVLLLAYALHRRDPLLICAFALGPVVQIRNLMLGQQRLDEAPAATATASRG